MAQLICNNLSLGYENQVIKSNISFSVNKGDYLCVIGENGSGKSTLMKAILKLNSQISGDIKFGDGLKEKQIGYLPQQTQAQRDFPATVYETVISGCLNKCGLRPFYNKEEKKLAYDNMQKLGIETLAKKCYRELSGGQQQRVLLARALCAASEMLILDEPVAALDPVASESLYELIKKINLSGTTIIMISHDIKGAVKYASHILDMNEPCFFGTKDEYLKRGGEYNV